MKTTLTVWLPEKLARLALLWALVLIGTFSTAQAQTTGRKVILGVYVGNEPAELEQFNNWLGKKADGVLAYTGERDWNDASPNWILGQFGTSGSELLWSIRMFPNGPNNGVANMREAANGQHNSRYQEWARTILNSRSGDTRPIYVRTTWELGGNWQYWTVAANADPQAFINAWRNFGQAFHSVSPRFKLVWDFVPDKGPQEQFYPGDDVVDVIGQDVYWHPQWETNDPDVAFDHDINYERGLNWMTDFATRHGKPMAIPEWGAPGGAHYERDPNGNMVLVWDGENLNGARYIERMKQWLETHDVVFATYWNGDSDYTGKLSDNAPLSTATALKNLYLNGVTTGGSTTPTPPPATTGIQSGGVYELAPQHAPGSRLTVAGGTGNGTSVTISASNGSANQAWKVTAVSGNIYELAPQASGATSRRLDVDGANPNDGGKVQIYDANSTPAQRWKLVAIDAANGVYELEPQCAIGKRLDVAAVRTADGSSVITYSINNGSNQRWKLTLKSAAASQQRLAASGAAGTQPAHLLVYPNPTAEQATIQYELDKAGPVRLELLNMQGHRVALVLDNVTQTPGAHQAIIPAGTLRAGTYRVVLTSPKAVESLSLQIR